jgi:hypothetical protein
MDACEAAHLPFVEQRLSTIKIICGRLPSMLLLSSMV